MGIVIYNGVSSWDYHIVVEHPPGYEYPERDYDMVHVPGRNGDIALDKGSYQNVERQYEIAIAANRELFSGAANRISEWLHSAKTYARLEDTYEPDYYRLALYKEASKVENILFRAGRATISFNCKPQRFLKSGEEVVKLSAGGLLRNPTGFEALPIITLKGSGSGTIRVGAYTVTISNLNGVTVINSDIQDAYSGVQNRNKYVTLNNGFPRLVPGENQISFSGGITVVEVIPNWWTL